MLYARRFSLLLALVVSALPLAAQAQSEEAAIRAMLQRHDRNVKSLVEGRSTLSSAQQTQLNRLFTTFFDFTAISRGVLGSEWSGLSSSQRRQFVDVFSRLVLQQSGRDLSLYRVPVSIGAVSVNGRTARATTTAQTSNGPVNVVYDLRKRGATWRATDITVGGAGLVEGFRRTFVPAIQEEGFNGLMVRLRDRLD